VSKFKFRLKTVLNVKELRKKQALADYNRVSEFLDSQERILYDLRKTSLDTLKLLDEQSLTGISIADIKMYFSYLRKVENEIKIQTALVEKIQEEKVSIQSKVFTIHNEVKVLKSLQAKKFNDYLKDLDGQEVKKMDELVNYRHNLVQ